MSGSDWWAVLIVALVIATWGWVLRLQTRLNAVEQLKAEMDKAATARRRFLARVVNRSLRAWGEVLK